MMVVGFHGTTREAMGEIRNEGFRSDINRRPKWLGNGVYFFQDGYGHASAWARFIAEKRASQPVVIRADISLKDCVDISDNKHWSFLKAFIETFPYDGVDHQLGLDTIYRDMDEETRRKLGWNYEDDFYVTGFFRSMKEQSGARSIRASFVEGFPVFRRSWLFDKSHICICVKDPSVIINYGLVEP